MTLTSTLTQIAILVGFLLPHLISVITQTHWNSGLKSLVAFSICILAAVLTVWAKGTLNLHDLVGTATVVYLMARSSYAGLWKPLGVSDSIEASTTLGGKPAP